MSHRVELEWLTPLPWADPSPFVLHRLYDEARSAVPRMFAIDTDTVRELNRLATWQRKIGAEFLRRLSAMWILVEVAGE